MSKTKTAPPCAAGPLLRLKPAAASIGLTDRQLRRAAHAGRVASYKPAGPTGPLMFDPADLAAFLAGTRTEAAR